MIESEAMVALGATVIVEVDDQRQVERFGFIVISARDAPSSGRVISVGTEVTDAVWHDLEVGDRVVLARYKGEGFHLERGGAKYLRIDEADVLARIDSVCDIADCGKVPTTRVTGARRREYCEYHGEQMAGVMEGLRSDHAERGEPEDHPYNDARELLDGRERVDQRG